MTLKKDTFVLHINEDNKGYVRFHGVDSDNEEESWSEVYLFTWMKGYGDEYYAIGEGDNQYYGGVEEGEEAFIIEMKGNEARLEYTYYSSLPNSDFFTLEIYFRK